VVSVPSQGEDAPSHRRPDDADRWPECGELATFHDVEVAESYGVFFVDVVKDRERAFACGACGELFDLKDTGIAAAAAAPTKARWERVEELAAEQRRRDEEQRRREVQVEDELAELKKRMGR